MSPETETRRAAPSGRGDLNKDYTHPVLEGDGANDYVRYMRTDELLSLQHDPDEVKHRDELLFQAVHQTTELWLKYACFEARGAVSRMGDGDHAGAARLVTRSAAAIGVLAEQLDMLLHLTPWSFQTVRTALGNGSGFESPGWQAVRSTARLLRHAFDEVIEADGIDLAEVYRGDPGTPTYQLAEAMTDWDDRVAGWRARHFKTATRIIGRGAVGTKGAPVETLSRLIDQEMFPALWRVRTELTDSGPMAGLCPVDHDSPLVTEWADAGAGTAADASTPHTGLVAPTPATFRSEFVALEGRAHLSSCSLGPRCRAVDAALEEMQAQLHQGAAAWDAYGDEVQRCRERFAALIGAEVDQIALVPNASVGAYQIASTVPEGARRTIVTTDAEFPSLAHVWLAQHVRGVDTHFVSRDHVVAGAGAASSWEERYAAAIDDRVAVVSVPLVTYDTGELLPAGAIGAVARDAGAATFIDAYQAVGVVPVDVRTLACDFLVAGTQKYLLGLPGVAFLYVRDGASTPRHPSLTGWFGRADPFAFDPLSLDFAPSARRFETGTPAMPAVYAANAGMGLLEPVGIERIRTHTARLVHAAATALRDQGRPVRFHGQDRHGAHFALTDPDPIGLARALAERDVRVSPRGDAIRIAFHFFNGERDVELLLGALAAVRPEPRRLR